MKEGAIKMPRMTGLELKRLIKELEKKHKNFDEMEVVFSGNEEYVSFLSKLEIKGLKKETAEIDPQYVGHYREPYDDENSDKKFIVFSY